MVYWLFSNRSNSATRYTPKLRHILNYCCWCVLSSHAYNSILEIVNIWLIFIERVTFFHYHVISKWNDSLNVLSKPAVLLTKYVFIATNFKSNYQTYAFPLKALDTFCNCQRPVLSVGVSQHMHTKTNLWKFVLIGHQSCKRIMKEKHPTSCTNWCAFKCLKKY